MLSDYIDVGMTLEEDSQYCVAPFDQIYTEIIEKHRPDIAKEIRIKK